jgi:hypothetical protein
LDVDHLQLIRNLVRWAAGEELPLEVTGRGVLDVTLWRQQNSLAAHLVNLTNPMLMKGPVRELMPVGEQTVRIRLPEGAQPERVRLLAAGSTPKFQQAGRMLTVQVPSVELHEIIAIDLRGATA